MCARIPLPGQRPSEGTPATLQLRIIDWQHNTDDAHLQLVTSIGLLQRQYFDWSLWVISTGHFYWVTSAAHRLRSQLGYPYLWQRPSEGTPAQELGYPYLGTDPVRELQQDAETRSLGFSSIGATSTSALRQLVQDLN